MVYTMVKEAKSHTKPETGKSAPTYNKLISFVKRHALLLLILFGSALFVLFYYAAIYDMVVLQPIAILEKNLGFALYANILVVLLAIFAVFYIIYALIFAVH